MTVTAADLIARVERHLLAGDRDEMNRLASSVDAGQGAVSFANDLGGIQPGSYISHDLEIMYVWDVNDSGKTATVQRGAANTTPAAHPAGSVFSVNPKFSKSDILYALNVEIADISPELFQVKDFTITTQPVRKTYPIPPGNDEMLEILEIRYQPPGPEFRWDRISRWSQSLLRHMPTTGDGSFASGMGFRVDDALYPGRPMRVVFSAPFSPLVNLTDDALAVTGLEASMLDIPPLGAAARLMGVRGAKRTFVEAEVDTRRAAEVPVGAAMQAAMGLYQQVENRIRSEVEQLRQQWPNLR